MSLKVRYECTAQRTWQEIPVPSSNGKNIHMVMIPSWIEYIEDSICDCESYFYRGSCRHQQIAFDQACFWESDEPATICPQCGSLVTTILDKDD